MYITDETGLMHSSGTCQDDVLNWVVMRINEIEKAALCNIALPVKDKAVPSDTE